MRNLAELSSEASEKLLGLFVAGGSPGLARRGEGGELPCWALPEVTLLQRAQQQKCLPRWEFKWWGRGVSATTSPWQGRNVGKHKIRASFGQQMKADPGS